MARPVHSQASRGRNDHARNGGRQKPWEAEEFDTAISWVARLSQPRNRLTSGSVVPLVVTVTAPVVLQEQQVEVFYAGSWRAAEWLGPEGHSRQAATMIEAQDLVHRILVRVRSGEQQPVMFAGHVRVSSR